MWLPKYEGRGVGLSDWVEVEGMGMPGAAKKTRHSICKCPTLMMLQYLQQYQSKWTWSCPVFWQMVQSCIFDFFLESWEMVGEAHSMG